jgi:hypothetical protein
MSVGRSAAEPTAGPGSAPLPVAALRVAPLRQAPPWRSGSARHEWLATRRWPGRELRRKI